MVRIYNEKELPSILRDMADYAEQCIKNDESVALYFWNIVHDGLFHDAIGKLEHEHVKNGLLNAEITTEY